jgi:hypothetical protein
MAVRTAYDAVAGTALTAANLDQYPGGWIGYNEVTSSQNTISTITDLTNLTVTVTVGTSRRIKVTGKIYCHAAAVVLAAELSIREGSTTLNGAKILFDTSTSIDQILLAQWIGTPGSGSHTYKLSLAASASTVNMTASATLPAFILVEDIGPAS